MGAAESGEISRRPLLLRLGALGTSQWPTNNNYPYSYEDKLIQSINKYINSRGFIRQSSMCRWPMSCNTSSSAGPSASTIC